MKNKDKRLFVTSTPETTHLQETIAVKKVPVDVNMVTIIKWINSFPGVITQWSCEGGDTRKPYVIFFEHELFRPETARLLARLCLYGEATITVFRSLDTVVYKHTFEFISFATRDLLTEYIKHGYK